MRTKRIDDRFFEAEALDYQDDRGRADIRRDPFRCVRIADATLPADAIGIEPAQIFKPEVGDLPDPAGIQMFYEMTYSRLDGEDISVSTELSIDDALTRQEVYDKQAQKSRRAVSMVLDAKTIRQRCLDFYRPKMKDDHQTFYKSSKKLDQANTLLLEETFGDLEFPLRLGRFSHVECVTVDRFRQPKTRRDPRTGRQLGFGGTRTLAAGLYAMGWAKVALEPIK